MMKNTCVNLPLYSNIFVLTFLLLQTVSQLFLQIQHTVLIYPPTTKNR